MTKEGGQLLYFWEVGASISTYFEQDFSSFSKILPHDSFNDVINDISNLNGE
jgi:hypothetical protein